MSYTPPEWLTKDFLQDVLREHFKDNDLEIQHLLATKLVIQKDDGRSEICGLSSELHKVSFSIKLNEHVASKKFSVIIKVHPKGLTGMIAYKRKLFKREIFTYKEIMPRIEELLISIGDKTKIAPICYYSTETPEPFLILEDMSLNGFKNYERCELLSLEYALITIKKMAKMHACSVVIVAENPKLMELFQDPPISHTQVTESQNCEEFFSAGIRLIAEELSHWPDHEEVSRKISKLADNILDKAAEMYKFQTDGFRVFNLCDTWIDNVLFHKDSVNNHVDNAILLDFQLAFYGSPSMDLNYFIYGSLNEDERKIHLKLLVREYQRILKETLNKLRYKGRIPTVKDLTIDMIKNSLQGVIAAFCLTPLIFMNKEETESADLEQLILNNENDGKTFLLNNIRNTKYRQFLQSTIQEFELNGFLDD